MRLTRVTKVNNKATVTTQIFSWMKKETWYNIFRKTPRNSVSSSSSADKFKKYKVLYNSLRSKTTLNNIEFKKFLVKIE